MDIYELKSVSKSALKTALILFVLLNHPFKYYCQIELEIHGDEDAQLLMQLNIDPLVAFPKQNKFIFHIPDQETASLEEIVTFYKHCPINLIYSIFEMDFEMLAPLINKKEVYAIIGDYMASLNAFDKALEYYTLAKQNSYYLNLKLGKSVEPNDPSDYYYLADTVEGEEKIKHFMTSGCYYHALQYIRQHLDSLNSQFVINTLSHLSMDGDKEGMKQIGIIISQLDKKQGKLYFDRVLSKDWSKQKLNQNKIEKLEKLEKSPQSAIMALLQSKEYKKGLKMAITQDIKISKDMHLLLLQSDLDLGEIYVKMGLIDFAIEFYLQHKDYMGLIKCFDLKIADLVDKSDYEGIHGILEKKLKIMNKLKIEDSNGVVKRDMEMVHVYLRGIKLKREECLKVMDALLKNPSIVKQVDIEQVILGLNKNK